MDHISDTLDNNLYKKLCLPRHATHSMIVWAIYVAEHSPGYWYPLDLPRARYTLLDPFRRQHYNNVLKMNAFDDVKEDYARDVARQRIDRAHAAASNNPNGNLTTRAAHGNNPEPDLTIIYRSNLYKFKTVDEFNEFIAWRDAREERKPTIGVPTFEDIDQDNKEWLKHLKKWRKQRAMQNGAGNPKRRQAEKRKRDEDEDAEEYEPPEPKVVRVAEPDAPVGGNDNTSLTQQQGLNDTVMTNNRQVATLDAPVIQNDYYASLTQQHASNDAVMTNNGDVATPDAHVGQNDTVMTNNGEVANQDASIGQNDIAMTNNDQVPIPNVPVSQNDNALPTQQQASDDTVMTNNGQIATPDASVNPGDNTSLTQQGSSNTLRTYNGQKRKRDDDEDVDEVETPRLKTVKVHHQDAAPTREQGSNDSAEASQGQESNRDAEEDIGKDEAPQSQMVEVADPDGASEVEANTVREQDQEPITPTPRSHIVKRKRESDEDILEDEPRRPKSVKVVGEDMSNESRVKAPLNPGKNTTEAQQQHGEAPRHTTADPSRQTNGADRPAIPEGIRSILDALKAQEQGINTTEVHEKYGSIDDIVRKLKQGPATSVTVNGQLSHTADASTPINSDTVETSSQTASATSADSDTDNDGATIPSSPPAGDDIVTKHDDEPTAAPTTTLDSDLSSAVAPTLPGLYLANESPEPLATKNASETQHDDAATCSSALNEDTALHGDHQPIVIPITEDAEQSEAQSTVDTGATNTRDEGSEVASHRSFDSTTEDVEQNASEHSASCASCDRLSRELSSCCPSCDALSRHSSGSCDAPSRERSVQARDSLSPFGFNNSSIPKCESELECRERRTTQKTGRRRSSSI